MKNLLIFIVFGFATILFFYQSIHPANAELTPFPAPEFTQKSEQAWINSSPLSINALKGSVILMDIWTFACWNCYRSFPWLNSLENKYKSKNFQLVGIHTPEFDHEKNRSAVEAKVKEFKLHHPVIMDNDFAYWQKLNNQYWPTFYLIDKQGQVRYRFIGETHGNTRKSNAIESAIELLLNE